MRCVKTFDESTTQMKWGVQKDGRKEDMISEEIYFQQNLKASSGKLIAKEFE